MINVIRLSLVNTSTPFYAAIMLALIWSGGIASDTYSSLQSGVKVSTIGKVAESAVVSSASNAALLDVSAIDSLNLFGKTAVEPVVDLATLPATQLNLKLSGIFVSTHSESSRALIAEESKPAKAFYVGDTLSGETRLHAIDNDFVIIQRGERLEKLLLHAASIATAAPVRHTAQLATLLPNPAPVSPSPQPVASALTMQTVYKGLADRLAAIRQAPTANTP